MSTHRYIDRICCAAIALALLLTLVLMNGSALGIQAADSALGYEDRLFDTGRVHTIDIAMDDWEDFLASCTDEEYVLCDLTIDGESYRNVAIRAKGNTSLTQVASYGNDRYSFKVEFDHYDSGVTYHGLDKLSLNNIIQDNTYMKDYLTYQMMGWMGAAAPLCSYAYLTVNGEDWGLYLAVEGVEDAFLERNYGSGSGQLYKPDSLSMGGGRGNGGDFDMADWMEDREDAGQTFDKSAFRQEMPDGMQPPGAGGGALPDGEAAPSADGGPTAQAEDSQTPDAAQEQLPGASAGEEGAARSGRDFGGMGGGAMGSDDVSLIYTDDDYDSYANIFDNAKTNITDADKDRLIASLKQLNEGEDIGEVVDVDQVIRYFVVHNFVCNFDSYTGSMIHNYYLYEEDGVLSMIPWDYNLAFGGFQGAQDATALVNYPIDTPVSGGTVESRPMLAWIFADETYTDLYHQYFAEFIASCFDSGYFALMMAETEALIAPYVEKDPTKFCTYEEFQTGVDALEQFCLLRAESVSGQLAGTIPSTDEGQSADSSTLVDASGLNISDMGSMNNGGMGGGMGRQDRGAAALSGDGTTGAETGGEDLSGRTDPEAPSAVPSDMGAALSGDGTGAGTGGEDLSGADPQAPSAAPDMGGALPDGEGGGGSAAGGSAGTASLSAPAAGGPSRSGPGEGGASLSGVTGENTLQLLGACGIVLLAGLLFAALYRKRA